jgi:hypothetical protein
MNAKAKLIIVTREHKILHEQEERKEKKNNRKLLGICSKEEEKKKQKFIFFCFYLKNKIITTFVIVMNLTCRLFGLFADCVVAVVSIDVVVVCFIMYMTIYIDTINNDW